MANDRVDSARDLHLLEEIERDPDTTQATLASRLGVAVGTVNWHLKRLITKGYIKVKRAERRKLRYILTPEGITLRARLTLAYIEGSMRLYRETRELARRLLQEARARGYRSVLVEGDGELADVCRLTCLEQGMPVAEPGQDGATALLQVVGREIHLQYQAELSRPSAGLSQEDQA
ncbi:MAG TPA: winged helix-turn-helix transcriptional regulator [Anaerolineales bacterium]|nr:winged helix-turn-helix transcriptional regulator [Anaerolineales bacterium]